MARYIATHGVQFADIDIQFTFDAEATGNEQTKVYAADLDTKQVAALQKLPAVERARYGIRPAPTDAFDDDVAETVEDAGSAAPVTIPEGKPTNSWTVPQIEALAAQEDVELPEGKKDVKLAALLTGLGADNE